ncbi:MAG TPA: class D sortase [Clostridiaceae bacterium]|nr:class D sortase [Clostridiaceae bacterium]
MKRFIGILLIIAGVSLVSYTLYMRYDAQRANDLLIQQFEESLLGLGELAETPDAGYKEDGTLLPTDNLPGTDAEPVLNPDGTTAPVKTPEEIQKEREQVVSNAVSKLKAVGIINIPKLGVVGPIVEGIGDVSLRYAVGYFPNTGTPGKGNFALASHRNYTYAHYFKDINKLKNGDEIVIRTKNGSFTYVVTGQEIVEPTDVEILKPTKSSTITLVTCTVDSKRRVIVYGKLKS